MTLANDLTGLGVAPAVASALGFNIATLAGVGTAQSGGAAIGADMTRVTTESGQTAVVLPSSMPLATPFFVFNTSATAALLFPPSGCAIDGGSADASVAIAQNRGRMVVRLSATEFRTVYGA
jgi:hypothetical protein